MFIEIMESSLIHGIDVAENYRCKPCFVSDIRKKIVDTARRRTRATIARDHYNEVHHHHAIASSGNKRL